MKRILITGGLGHIGSRLIRSIEVGEFSEVRILDNMRCQRYSSLFDLNPNISYNFFEDDILTFNLDTLLKDIDCVVHLAAITDATQSFQRAEEVDQVNYVGTVRIAEACLSRDIPLIFPSTTSVYGSQSNLVDESCSLIDLKPQSPYASSKLRCEQILASMCFERGLQYTVLRLGTIFGVSSGMRFHTAVNKFCWQAVMGVPLTVWRTAMNQRRPYLGVNDCVETIKFIIKEELYNNDIYNVVSCNSSVSDIVDIISNIIPTTRIELVDHAIMNQLSYEVSGRKLTQLGCTLTDKLDVGITETLKLVGAAGRKYYS